MNGHWIGSRYFVGHVGYEWYFTPVNGRTDRVELDRVVPVDGGDGEPQAIPQTVKRRVRQDGLRLDTRTAPTTLAEAM